MFIVLKKSAQKILGEGCSLPSTPHPSAFTAVFCSYGDFTQCPSLLVTLVSGAVGFGVCLFTSLPLSWESSSASLGFLLNIFSISAAFMAFSSCLMDTCVLTLYWRYPMDMVSLFTFHV